MSNMQRNDGFRRGCLHLWAQIRPGSHLLLVFSLRVEASLDAFPGLLEGLPLGALGGVMSAHSHDVGAREDQHVRHDLSETVRGEGGVGAGVHRKLKVRHERRRWPLSSPGVYITMTINPFPIGC